MDTNDFKTLGECEFGTIWEVQSENRIVVNAYQAALYFSRDDFFRFAKMVEDSVRRLTGKGFVQPEEKPDKPAKDAKDAQTGEVKQISDFLSFRKNRVEQPSDEDDSIS